MPSSSPCAFRAVCGAFTATLICILTRKADARLAARVKVVTVRSKTQGVIVGWTLVLLFWGSLLLRCGDVETNPGPVDSTRNLRQSRLSTSGTGGSGSAAVASKTAPVKSVTLEDVMERLVGMGGEMVNVNSNIANLKTEMSEMKVTHEKNMKDGFSAMTEQLSTMQSNVTDIMTQFQETKEKVTALETENDKLKLENAILLDRMDDLENRSRRNNVVFYGIKKEEGENCETVLKTICREKLKIDRDIEFDRAHRTGKSADAPIVARCTFYKDRESILKSKRSLFGSEIFVGEDFSKRTRQVRKALNGFKKDLKKNGKKVAMVYDHLYVDDKKYYLSPSGDSLIEAKDNVIDQLDEESDTDQE